MINSTQTTSISQSLNRKDSHTNRNVANLIGFRGFLIRKISFINRGVARRCRRKIGDWPPKHRFPRPRRQRRDDVTRRCCLLTNAATSITGRSESIGERSIVDRRRTDSRRIAIRRKRDLLVAQAVRHLFVFLSLRRGRKQLLAPRLVGFSRLRWGAFHGACGGGGGRGERSVRGKLRRRGVRAAAIWGVVEAVDAEEREVDGSVIFLGMMIVGVIRFLGVVD